MRYWACSPSGAKLSVQLVDEELSAITRVQCLPSSLRSIWMVASAGSSMPGGLVHVNETLPPGCDEAVKPVGGSSDGPSSDAVRCTECLSKNRCCALYNNAARRAVPLCQLSAHAAA